jgi:hypothetical protein
MKRLVSRTSAVDPQRSSLSEASDMLALSVTRHLIRGSEKVALRMIRAISQAVRGCVKVPVMARSIGGVGVTRPIVSGHVG